MTLYPVNLSSRQILRLQAWLQACGSSRRQALSPLSPSELPWLCSQPTVRANNNRLFSGEEESESRKMSISMLAMVCHTRRTVFIKMVSMIVPTTIIIKNKTSHPKVFACVLDVPLHMYYLSNHSLFWWSKILSEHNDVSLPLD